MKTDLAVACVVSSDPSVGDLGLIDHQREITGLQFSGAVGQAREPSVSDTTRPAAAVSKLVILDVAGDLRARLRRVLSGGGRAIRRLGSAGTTVTFRIGGGTPESVTLLLDRRPPTVANGDEPAETVIELSAEQARLFAAGQLSLPTAIADCEVACRGPVRKYLAVDPIIRALLVDARGRAHRC